MLHFRILCIENINDFYSLLLKAQEDARKEGENVDKLTDTHIFQTIADIFGGTCMINVYIPHLRNLAI